ncbi:MAG: SOS response-associated peptidase [Acidimicrobiia bacterium]|nr:SOS response-associated peptidase [Acidimicrobiia bacterium]
MCGRFVSAAPPDELARYFDVQETSETALDPSYNVAPTDDVYVVVETGGLRRLDTFHWGLVPFWARDIKVGQKMINARAETIATNGAYKRAFRKRRCLIPADGFYEWQKRPTGPKQPMYIRRADGEAVALAGLWEMWKPKATADDRSTWVRSCTIITGQPNEVVAPIHDRMPVMLPPSAWDTWLDPTIDDADSLGQLLVPVPASLLTAHPVSTKVNNVREGGPILIEEAEPLPVEPRQPKLIEGV